MNNEFQTGRLEQDQIFKESITNVSNIQEITLLGTRRGLCDARKMYISKQGNFLRIKIEGEGQIFVTKDELLKAIEKLKE